MKLIQQIHESFKNDRPQKTHVDYILSKYNTSSLGDNDLYSIKRSLYHYKPLIHIPQREKLVTHFKNRDYLYFMVHPGRRCGKTETLIRLAIQLAFTSDKALPIIVAAPTYGQAKDVLQDKLVAMSCIYLGSKKPKINEMAIYFPNGNTIKVRSLDKPEKIEGQDCQAIFCTEFDFVKDNDIWQKVILPTLSTNGLDAQCFIEGTPSIGGPLEKFLEYERLSPDKFYCTSQPSHLVIGEEAVNEYKKTMDYDIQRQKYFGEFIKPHGTIYYNYDPKLNHTNLEIKDNFTLIWTHDQNYNPQSSCIGIRHKDEYHILDEIILSQSGPERVAREFVNRYKNHNNRNVLIYGDVSGDHHNSSSDFTYYETITKILRNNGQIPYLELPNINPPVTERHNAVRNLICSGTHVRRLFVNTHKCPVVNRGLLVTKTAKGSYKEDGKDESHHVTTAVGYWLYRASTDNGVLRQLNR